MQVTVSCNDTVFFYLIPSMKPIFLELGWEILKHSRKQITFQNFWNFEVGNFFPVDWKSQSVDLLSRGLIEKRYPRSKESGYPKKFDLERGRLDSIICMTETGLDTFVCYTKLFQTSSKIYL